MVSDLSSFSNLINIHELDITRTKVSDVTPLASITNLDELSAKDTNFTDFSSVDFVRDLSTGE